MEGYPEALGIEGVNLQYAVLIEREEGAPTVGAYSPDVSVYVVRDASATDDEMIAAFKEALKTYVESMRQDGKTLPPARHRAAMVEAA